MKTNQEGPLAEDVIHSDEYAGKGGSFVLDPGTGTRVPTADTVEHLARAFPVAEKVQSQEDEDVAVTNE